MDQVRGYESWYAALTEMNDNAVAVIEVDEMQQSKLHPGVLGWLLDA
jgi:methionyl-tRNA formyltransferase